MSPSQQQQQTSWWWCDPMWDVRNLAHMASWFVPLLASEARCATLPGGETLQPPPPSIAASTVVVTGASSGIGLACACALAKAGWHVVAVCRTGQSAKEAWHALVRLGAPTHRLAACIACDLASPSQVVRLASTLLLLSPSSPSSPSSRARECECECECECYSGAHVMIGAAASWPPIAALVNCAGSMGQSQHATWRANVLGPHLLSTWLRDPTALKRMPWKACRGDAATDQAKEKKKGKGKGKKKK